MGLRDRLKSPYRFPYNFTNDYLRWRHWWSAVKFVYNRVAHGVSYHDVWSFDHHLSHIICKGIEQLYEGHGYPANFEEPEEWQAILADMHEGFYYHATYWDWYGDVSKEEYERRQKLLERS